MRNHPSGDSIIEQIERDQVQRFHRDVPDLLDDILKELIKINKTLSETEYAIQGVLENGR